MYSGKNDVNLLCYSKSIVTPGELKNMPAGHGGSFAV